MNWISVEDQKPTPGEQVLMYSRTEGVLVGYYRGENHHFIADLDGSTHTEISHWMRLPDSPV